MDLTRLLAHEIQAPLLSLELQLQRLLEQSPDSDLAESCLHEVRTLKHLVTHVLELGAPELTPRPVDLGPVFQRLARRFRPIAAARNVRLSIEAEGTELFGDANATERILSNLIDNAIKFSHRDGSVELVTRVRDGSVELEVRDEGVGIAHDVRERVFEPFYRVDRETAGTGLGLAISKQLAHAQRGELRCESELGRGSVFILTLPVSAS